ncbi:DUF6314 family protein [Tropicimonas sp. S265A]|uniref:DUF6314 family protein n=1 Tax=Tropicimonas sp. S265A TaxID=3415134 RepID=UPI003C7DF1A8
MQDSHTGPVSLASFEGMWRVQRRIEDRLGTPARFEGEAHFTPIPEGLAYSETGRMHVGSQAFSATRGYIWRATGAGISVWFDEARFFHSFTLGLSAVSSHHCAPDQYDVRYVFDAWPVWTSDWRVRGPRKDYRMVTEYTRG